MTNLLALVLGLVLFTATGSAKDGEVAPTGAYLEAGVGSVDITPTEPVVLAGSPTVLKSQSVQTRLYAKALVLSAGGQKVAIVTLDTLKYLIHGGRISHIKGLLASLLHIRPVITVDPETGKYTQLAQERTMKRSVQKMVELLSATYATGSEMRMQLMHGANPEMVAIMKECFDQAFRCTWLPTISVAPVLEIGRAHV